MAKGSMTGMFKQAAKLQESLMKAQEDLVNMTVEGSSGGGMVKVVANGKQEIISIKIEQEVAKEDDIEMLEDLVTAAVNQALEKSNELAKNHMEKMAGGMLSMLPSGFKFPGM